MNINSRLVEPADRGLQFPVIHTEIENDKASFAIVTTVLSGSIKKRNLPKATQEFLNRFLDIHETIFPNGLIYVVDLSDGDEIEARIQQSIIRVHNGDAVIYFCDSPLLQKKALLYLAVENGSYH